MEVYEKHLPGGFRLLVDAADRDLADSSTWHPVTKRKCVYAVRYSRPRSLYLHQLLVAVGPDQQVDHRNHDGLDNRRSNLRISTRSQNQANRRIPRNNTSGFKGVSWDRTNRKWQANITINNRQIKLGRYIDAVDAAVAYNAAAIEAWGEFALLNILTTNSILEPEITTP
jgi:hypothetical protein